MERLAMEAEKVKESPEPDRPKHDKASIKSPKKSSKNKTMSSSNDEKKSKKKNKLYCVCQKPYDKDR